MNMPAAPTAKDIHDATVTPKKRAPIENVAVRIKDIEVNEDAFSFFVGNRIDNDAEVRIRLMTVEEAVEANRRKEANEGDLERSRKYFTEKFATGTHIRPNAQKFADPAAKEHVQPGGVVLFDRAIKNDDGTYRAQWASTIAPSPENEAMKVVIHLDGRDENPSQAQKATVRATIVNPDKAILLTPENRAAALEGMLLPTTKAGNPRNPSPVLRVTLSDGSPAHAILPTMTKSEIKKDFNTGLERKIATVLSPNDAIDAILANPDMGKTQNGKMAKAILSGLTGKPADWSGVPEGSVQTLQKLAANITAGKTPVIAIPGERVYAGPQAAKKMMADAAKNTAMSKLLNQVETVEITVNGQPVKTHHPTYTEAYVGIFRHDNTKAPYLRDVFATSPWPKQKKLADLALGPDAKIATAEIADPADELPDLGAEGDHSIDKDVDAALAQAAQGMDEMDNIPF
jgi:hypothetical protein